MALWSTALDFAWTQKDSDKVIKVSKHPQLEMTSSYLGAPYKKPRTDPSNLYSAVRQAKNG